MKVAVVTFPGSNCDEDTVHVWKNVLGVPAERVWHKDTTLPACDLVVLPGGFSYGDALRSGALARFSPIMSAVRAHADRGGFLLGICNGFQILLEAGLLDGAVLPNASRTFVSKTVRLRCETTNTPWSAAIAAGAELQMPVAHHQGRFFADEATMKRLEAEDRIVFRYAKDDNPNGSQGDVAGIVNAGRNIFGLMPHPERASEAVLGSVDGLGVFRSIAAASGRRSA